MRKTYVMVSGVLVPGQAPRLLPARDHGRHKTGDVAFNLRTGAGSPGDITRPGATIEPCLMAAVTPPDAFGQAVVADGLADNAVRKVQAGDSALTAIYGITVRPYPFQQPTTSNYSGAIGFGQGAPAPFQPVDICRRGYMLVYINGVPIKGQAVFVWVAASAGAHLQGGFEAAATGGSTIQLDSKSTFQGGVDAAGFGEICFNL